MMEISHVFFWPDTLTFGFCEGMCTLILSRTEQKHCDRLGYGVTVLVVGGHFEIAVVGWFHSWFG